jgi:hypothetical protein
VVTAAIIRLVVFEFGVPFSLVSMLPQLFSLEIFSHFQYPITTGWPAPGSANLVLDPSNHLLSNLSV